MRQPILRSAIQISMCLAFAVGCYCASDIYYPGAHLLSPDGQHVAIFYGLGGGGAAGWLEEFFSVRMSDSPFGHDKANIVRAFSHTYELCVKWESATRIRVVYPAMNNLNEAPYRAEASPEILVDFVFEQSSDGLLRNPCVGTLVRPGRPDSEW